MRYSHASVVSLMRNDSVNIETVAKGMGTLSALMHHFCDANIGFLQEKRHFLIYSLKPIKAGEQVFYTCRQQMIFIIRIISQIYSTLTLWITFYRFLLPIMSIIIDAQIQKSANKC